MIPGFPHSADQPDYANLTPDDRPHLGAMIRAHIARYMHGDPPFTDRDHDHEARDPASWRRFTIHRTRWRIAREHEADRDDMIRDHHDDYHADVMGSRPFRPTITPRDGIWLGEGEEPWSVADDD